MKKIIILMSMFFSLVTLATIGIQIVNNNEMSVVGRIFSNMEALAADTEAGGKGKPCTFSKEFTGLKSDTAYECIDPGRTVCIIWEQFKQLGTERGNCTNAQ